MQEDPSEFVIDEPTTADPREQDEKRTPEAWAAHTGRVRKPPRGIVLVPAHGANPFHRHHRAAAARHGWKSDPSFVLTLADYEAAITASKTFQVHGPAVPGQGV